jgi:hypothetical protein
MESVEQFLMSVADRILNRQIARAKRLDAICSCFEFQGPAARKNVRMAEVGIEGVFCR